MRNFNLLDDKTLLHWAEYYEERHRMAQEFAVSAQARYEEFLAEVVERGLIDDLVKKTEHG